MLAGPSDVSGEREVMDGTVNSRRLCDLNHKRPLLQIPIIHTTLLHTHQSSDRKPLTASGQQHIRFGSNFLTDRRPHSARLSLCLDQTGLPFSPARQTAPSPIAICSPRIALTSSTLHESRGLTSSLKSPVHWLCSQQSFTCTKCCCYNSLCLLTLFGKKRQWKRRVWIDWEIGVGDLCCASFTGCSFARRKTRKTRKREKRQRMCSFLSERDSLTTATRTDTSSMRSQRPVFWDARCFYDYLQSLCFSAANLGRKV